jgi:hypothetical protein
MRRSLVFASALMLCVSSGWPTAYAQARLSPTVRKSTAKLIGEGAGLAAKSVSILRVEQSAQETNRKWTLEGSNLILHRPVRFNLPFGGEYKSPPKISLWWPSGIAASVGCYQWQGCKDFTDWVKSLIQPQPEAGPKKGDDD